MAVCTGFCKWFDSTKGYGFITTSEGDEVFVHQSEIYARGFRSLAGGEEVQCVVTEDGNGKKKATNVKGLDGGYVRGDIDGQRQFGRRQMGGGYNNNGGGYNNNHGGSAAYNKNGGAGYNQMGGPEGFGNNRNSNRMDGNRYGGNRFNYNNANGGVNHPFRNYNDQDGVPQTEGYNGYCN